MATKTEFSNFQSYLEYFKFCINDIVLKRFGNSSSDDNFSGSAENSQDNIRIMLNTTRRTEKYSDVIVKINTAKIDVNVLHGEISQCEALKRYLESSFVDEYENIHFVLDRKTFINDIFNMVITKGVKYGENSEPVQGHVLINCSASNDQDTIGHLRNILLCNHMAQILKLNRWKVNIHSSNYDSREFGNEDNEPGYFDISNLTSAHNKENYCRAESILCHNFQTSPYRTESTTTVCLDKSPVENEKLSDKKSCNLQDNLNTTIAERENASSTQDSCSGDVNMVRINLDKNINFNVAKYIEDLKRTGEMNEDSCCSFYKTLKNVNVSSIWDDVLYLEVLNQHSEKPSNSQMIHVCVQGKLVHWKKVALTWRLLTHEKNFLAENQMFLCHAGSLSCSDKSVHELLRVRTKQVRHSYITKYGANVNDMLWTETITNMAASVIKLELMLVPLKSQVKVDITDSEDFPATSRQALFVLYNCARLSKISEKYNSDVTNGIYPPLPDLNHIDFSILKDQLEWNLVLKYVANYPVILKNFVKYAGESCKRIKFNSNEVAQFLVAQSQDISSYYSRVHILLESREHLNQLMFARLYLVKALYQVMRNALKILNIEAVDQM